MPRRKRWYSKNTSTDPSAPQEGQPAGDASQPQNNAAPRRPRKNNQPRPASMQQGSEPAQGGQPQNEQSPHPRRPRRNNQPPRQPRQSPPPAQSGPSSEETPRQQANQNRRGDSNRQSGGPRRPDRPRQRRRIFDPGPVENNPETERTEIAAGQPASPQSQPRREWSRSSGPRRDDGRRGQRNSLQGGPPQITSSQAPRGQGQPRQGTRPDYRRDRRPDTRVSLSDFTSPIPTNKGIKARSQRGAFSKNWWARRWIEAMERIVDPHRLQRGRSYARQGQVLSIEETSIGIEARVQGSRPQPYKVTMQLTPLTDEQWDQVISALAEQAIFTAQLLAGEMPEDIEAAFLSAGVSLFPYQAGDLYTDCTCPDWANPCKHVAASHYILGDRFDDDPFLLFRMRGRNQDQILQALRERRSGNAGEMEIIEEPAPEVMQVPPLNEVIDHFWQPLESLDTFPLTIRPPTVDMPLLKRLGEPAFLGGGSIEDILHPVYTTFSRSAFRAAYSEEEPLESSTNGNGDAHENQIDDAVDGTGDGYAVGSNDDRDSDTSLY